MGFLAVTEFLKSVEVQAVLVAHCIITGEYKAPSYPVILRP